MNKRKRSRITTPLLNSEPVYWFLRCLLKLWSLIPYPLSANIAGAVTSALAPLLSREQAVMDAQMELAALNCSTVPNCRLASCVERTARSEEITKVFRHMGQIIAESISIPRLLQLKKDADPNDDSAYRYIEVEQDSLYLQLAREGKGCVVLSAHIGCFELLAAYYAKRGVNLAVIGRLPNYSSIARLLKSLRATSGVETIWREESGPKALVRAIRSNQCIAPLIDQDIDLTNKFTPFFGLDAAHPNAPIRLAVKNKLPIFVAWILRLPSNKHKVVMRELKYDPASPSVVEDILKEYCRRIEAVIAEHPGQWLWWHRRWRRRPGIDYNANPDQLLGAKDYVTWLREQINDLKSSRETSKVDG